MVRSRFLVAVLVVLVVGPLATVGPAAGADARLTLTDTTVTPATPTAGAPITAETTVRLSGGSNTSLALDSVRVVRSPDIGEDVTLGNATALGRLSPGETLTVPVTFTVNRPRSYDLRLVAVGSDEDGDTVRATRPLTVGVERGQPQVELRTDGLVARADTPVTAVVSNPTTAPLRGIELRVTDPATGERTRRTVPTLAAGASQTVNLSVRAPEPGERPLEVTTTFVTPNGVESSSTFSKTVAVAPLSTDVGVRAQRAQGDDTQQVPGGLTGILGGGGGGGALQPQSGDDATSESRADVTVTNFGNAAVENVVLTGETPDGTVLSSVGRFALTDELAPGESTTVTVDLTGVRTTDGVRFVAHYDAPTGRTESAVGYDYAAKRGAAAVTGLDVSVDDDGRVRVDGNLANVGDGEVTSAVVAVQPTRYVEPAYPQRNYFVGSVASSEFAPFELTAQADTENATSVTVRVDYTVDGERVSDTTEVPLPAEDGTNRGSDQQSLGIALAVTVGLVVTVAVTLFARRARDR
ncbi:hypothetical protein [Haloarcula pellucida]|uniref:CARDB protein n=1 Tax=Haloarcula pellucida TaxID=1427151 RepID=A0A830GG36_9EURY|nr:hypothetical protein [Halomicroarcula pellucida]MBX0346914.1 hypothetical protein [Halomicroarcula pellucida]GGN86056.1 hypothetical protein GCM10009030_03350 [Halomicroarcula pellucida]